MYSILLWWYKCNIPSGQIFQSLSLMVTHDINSMYRGKKLILIKQTKSTQILMKSIVGWQYDKNYSGKSAIYSLELFLKDVTIGGCAILALSLPLLLLSMLYIGWHNKENQNVKNLWRDRESSLLWFASLYCYTARWCVIGLYALWPS